MCFMWNKNKKQKNWLIRLKFEMVCHPKWETDIFAKNHVFFGFYCAKLSFKFDKWKETKKRRLKLEKKIKKESNKRNKKKKLEVKCSV